MNLQTTRLVVDDYERDRPLREQVIRTEIHRFVDKAWFLYRALFQQSRAIQAPEDFDGPILEEARDIFEPRVIL